MVVIFLLPIHTHIHTHTYIYIYIYWILLNKFPLQERLKRKEVKACMNAPETNSQSKSIEMYRLGRHLKWLWKDWLLKKITILPITIQSFTDTRHTTPYKRGLGRPGCDDHIEILTENHGGGNGTPSLRNMCDSMSIIDSQYM